MSKGGQVIDASALLCLLFQEPGAERVEQMMNGAKMSAANLSEVIAKLIDKGADHDEIVADLFELDLEIVDFDRSQAEVAGRLRASTRAAGLSLGDRACLALAAALGATALTTDRQWRTLDLDIKVDVIR